MRDGMNKQKCAALLSAALIAWLWITVLTTGLCSAPLRAEPGDGNIPDGRIRGHVLPAPALGREDPPARRRPADGPRECGSGERFGRQPRHRGRAAEDPGGGAEDGPAGDTDSAAPRPLPRVGDDGPGPIRHGGGAGRDRGGEARHGGADRFRCLDRLDAGRRMAATTATRGPTDGEWPRTRSRTLART